MVREAFTTGDLGRGEGLVVATWLGERKRPEKPEEGLLPNPRENGECHGMQL